MATFNEHLAAGTAYAFGWFIDSNGFPTGGTSSAPSQGAAGSAAFRIRGIKSASPTIPDPERVPVTGDDTLLAEFQFASIATRGFNIEYSIESLTLLSRLLNTTIQTWGEARVALLDIPNPPDYNMGFILQGKAKKQDTGVAGQAAWSGIIMPLSTATPLGRSTFEERGAAVFRYSISPQIAGYDPFGITFGSAVYGQGGALGGRYMPFDSEYPVTLHTWRGTGALSTFTLDYQPVSAAKTPGYSNRVALSTSSVSTTAPYSVTYGSTPAGAAAVVSVYEFQG
jgi:hypothetical protein